MKTQVVQKAVVLNKMGEMLMLRRSKTDIRRPLQWDLPGGLCEDGEELIASVNREIIEETSLKVTELMPIYAKTEIRNWKDENGQHEMNVVFIFYVGKTSSNDVRLSYEHDKFQWKPIETAQDEFEYYLHREVLKHLKENKLIPTYI